MKLKAIQVSAALLLLGTPVLCGAQDIQTIVDQFYPDRLTPASSEFRRSCYLVLRTTGGGEPDVVAAGYTDTSNAMLRLLSRVGPSTYVVSYETPTSISMTGITCQISGRDLDGNGQPDVFVELSFGKGTNDWAFKWAAETLENITPTALEDTLDHSLLVSSETYDFYHDGKLQIVSSGSVDDDVSTGFVRLTPHKIFRLGSSTYQFEKWVVLVEWFKAGSDPRANMTNFTKVVDSTGPYTVRIVNGDRTGQKRVTSGAISLNGVELVAAGQLTDQVEFLTRTVATLPTDNSLIATITGPPDAEITLTVEDSTVR